MTDHPEPIAQIFRTEWPRLVGALVRDLRDLQLAEDCASVAFVTASQAWVDESGRWSLPAKPGAWLLTAARRHGIDQIRRADRYQDKLAQVAATARSASAAAQPHTLADDQLALIFGCCNPALGPEAQVALTLRSVAGLTTAEIARAFLVPEATMAKRLTRAKKKIVAANIAFTMPGRADLGERVQPVLAVLYLIFNQGHTSAQPAQLVRGDLCDEAIWLAELLVRLLPDEPEANSLAALLLLTDARRQSRVDATGLPVMLEDQDRSRWDADKIERGRELLVAAHKQGEPGLYGLQAAVALVHAKAQSFSATDWTAIVEIYDRLIELRDAPLFRLNRAVAVSYLDGPAAGLVELDRVADLLPAGYHYAQAARGELLARCDRRQEALVAYRHAVAECPNPVERDWLEGRISALQ